MSIQKHVLRVQIRIRIRMVVIYQLRIAINGEPRRAASKMVKYRQIAPVLHHGRRASLGHVNIKITTVQPMAHAHRLIVSKTRRR